MGLGGYMTDPAPSPAVEILTRWNDWARANHRPDMSRAIWRIYDLLEGRFFPPESQRVVDTFLAERAKSPDLETVEKAVEDATNKHTPPTVQDTSPQLEIF